MDILSKCNDQWVDMVENEFKLNHKDEIHQAAVHAVCFNKHLHEAAKKTTARKFETELDKVTEQSLQLFETIKSLEGTYKNGLMFSLHRQHDINVRENKEIENFIQSLAQAAQAVKKVYLAPIPNGFYNAFLFKFVVGVLTKPVIEYRCLEYLILNNVKQPTKEGVKEFLCDLWEERYSTKVRETAIHVITIKLSTSRNRQSAQKAVDQHLGIIVDDQLEFKASKLIRLNTFSAEKITQVRVEMGLE